MRKGWLRAILVVCIVLITGWYGFKYVWYLGFAPQGLGVWYVAYSKEQAWGFGPGGNESGVIVYELSESAAGKVAAGGSKYLTELSTAADGGSRGFYQDWKATPISNEAAWLPRDHAGRPSLAGREAGIADYLNRYGFGIQIDENVRALIDNAFRSPGNYYAYGRGGGLVIVAPSARRVFFAYTG